MRNTLMISTALFAVLVGLSSCAHETRYRIATFLFDGVPPPEAEAELIVSSEKSIEADSQDVDVQTELIVSTDSEHAPFAGGNCSSCHDTLNSNQITASGAELCLSCHPTVISGKPFVHVIAQFDCQICHNPHRSDQTYLLNKPIVDLCLDCHKRSDVEEVHGEIGDCMACHNPHESDMPSLLDFS